MPVMNISVSATAAAAAECARVDRATDVVYLSFRMSVFFLFTSPPSHTPPHISLVHRCTVTTES